MAKSLCTSRVRNRLECFYRALRRIGRSHLSTKPRALLDAMIAKSLNAPPASSCGRLFDAVAALLGACRERQAYEGEAAARLEALAEDASRSGDCDGVYYPFRLWRLPNDLLQLDASPLWNAIIDDLADEISATAMAVRFHRGLIRALVEATEQIAARVAKKTRLETVALSGGCFQNRILFENVAATLRKAGFDVLAHAEVPANDGGLALGQAAIGAALLMNTSITANEGSGLCV